VGQRCLCATKKAPDSSASEYRFLVLGVPIRVHDMTGDDLGIAHVPTPVETGDLILLERGEYRVRDVILIPLDEGSPVCTCTCPTRSRSATRDA
jgi:hypothetical protein